MVVEDCAHAFGAEYNGKKLSNHGNICVYSTQAIKHLTTGDGGIITLPNEKLYNRCKLLRWFGIDRDKRNFKGKDFRLEHDIAEYGYKYHMNDINATIVNSTLVDNQGAISIGMIDSSELNMVNTILWNENALQITSLPNNNILNTRCNIQLNV